MVPGFYGFGLSITCCFNEYLRTEVYRTVQYTKQQNLDWRFSYQTHQARGVLDLNTRKALSTYAWSEMSAAASSGAASTPKSAQQTGEAPKDVQNTSVALEEDDEFEDFPIEGECLD